MEGDRGEGWVTRGLPHLSPGDFITVAEDSLNKCCKFPKVGSSAIFSPAVIS